MDNSVSAERKGDGEVGTVKLLRVKKFECTESIKLNTDENIMCFIFVAVAVPFCTWEIVYTINTNIVYLHEKKSRKIPIIIDTIYRHQWAIYPAALAYIVNRNSRGNYQVPNNQ